MLACVMPVPARPVPHAEVLDELLSKFLGDSYSNSALFEFILGGTNPDRNTSYDNLDISILDVDTVKNIIKFAKQKYEKSTEHAEKTGRRNSDNRIFSWDMYVINSSLSLMKQTIYMTKERINLTRSFRKKYSGDSSYKIALLYGAAAAILGKMEALLNQIKSLPWKTHFLWHLIIYEKLLACNIDISDSVEKIFLIQGEFEVLRGPKPTASSFKLTPAEEQLVANNPLMRDEIMAQKILEAEKAKKG